MKITVFEGNFVDDNPKEAGWYLISDSAWTNAGKHFYIPEETDQVIVALAPVVRFNRLGKSIAEKFAHRYYSEIAPAVHFILPKIKETLTKKGLSFEPAVSFDRSLIVGSFSPASHPFDDMSYNLAINGEIRCSWHPDMMKLSIETIISLISKMNTVKMGDFLIPSLSGFFPVKIGDLLEVTGKDRQPLLVKVK